MPARRHPSLTGRTNFHFLGETGSLADRGWDSHQCEKLWRYNQHYFDDLNAFDAKDRESWHYALIQLWIEGNPPRQGSGWEPYPASLRIVNWVKWDMGGEKCGKAMLESLAIQARWLRANVEYHLLGNHLISNAKALIFAGSFFAGAEAEEWRQLGLDILAREFPEQILADGGNFERSPMYHALCLEDVLDLVNLAAAYPLLFDAPLVEDWHRLGSRMLRWLRTMTHPDGEIAQFNDCALDIAPQSEELERYACALGVSAGQPTSGTNSLRVTSLANSGYIRLQDDDSCAFLDVAPIGPDYLPAHGHADTLAFELSVGDSRVIVNGGTSCYGDSAIRLLERGTASHSTVVVDDRNSSEVWGRFRVAQRAYPFDLAIASEPDCMSVSCSHDGYRKLAGSPVHRRRWEMRDGSMELFDTVTGNHRAATSKLLFHPSIIVRKMTDRIFELVTPAGRKIAVHVITGEARLEQSWHASRFGERVKTVALHNELVAGQSRIVLDWADALEIGR